MNTPAAYDSGPVGVPAGLAAERVRSAFTLSAPEHALRGVIELAVQSGPCDAASITVLGPRETFTTVAFSDDQALESDRLQYQFGEGPCVDAVSMNEVLVVTDLTVDERWPRWAPAAAALGIRASVSVHLFTDASWGSLNLYSLSPREFGPTDLRNAEVIAAHASVVLAYTRAQEQLRGALRAMESRNLIGQAQGMLMHRYGLNAAQAFAVLRRYSQDHNVKVTVLAGQLTSTGELPGVNGTVRQPEITDMG